MKIFFKNITKCSQTYPIVLFTMDKCVGQSRRKKHKMTECGTDCDLYTEAIRTIADRV